MLNRYLIIYLIIFKLKYLIVFNDDYIYYLEVARQVAIQLTLTCMSTILMFFLIVTTN